MNVSRATQSPLSWLPFKKRRLIFLCINRDSKFFSLVLSMNLHFSTPSCLFIALERRWTHGRKVQVALSLLPLTNIRVVYFPSSSPSPLPLFHIRNSIHFSEITLSTRLNRVPNSQIWFLSCIFPLKLFHNRSSPRSRSPSRNVFLYCASPQDQ